jgi:ribosomal protein S18 acetylase RimI-like enzyme
LVAVHDISVGSAAMEIRRLADGDDAARAGWIVQQAYFALDGYPHDPAYDELLGNVAARAHDADVIVALRDDQIVGCLTFVSGLGNPHFDFHDPDAGSFRYFGIDPNAQGQGIGEAMVQWCIDEARRRGRARLRIHTLESMVGAQRLYARLGFRRTVELDEDWDGIVGLAFVLEFAD